MATASGLTTRVAPGVYQTKWTIKTATGGIGSVSVGRGFTTRRALSHTVHVYGTFASNGKLRMQGSNDTTVSTGNWATLKDWGSTAITATAAAMYRISPSPNLIRPFLVCGDVAKTVSVTVELLTIDERES